jgi:hypothetical protein
MPLTYHLYRWDGGRSFGGQNGGEVEVLKQVKENTSLGRKTIYFVKIKINFYLLRSVQAMLHYS